VGISEAEMPTGPRVGLRQGLPGGFWSCPSHGAPGGRGPCRVAPVRGAGHSTVYRQPLYASSCGGIRRWSTVPEEFLQPGDDADQDRLAARRDGCMVNIGPSGASDHGWLHRALAGRPGLV